MSIQPLSIGAFGKDIDVTKVTFLSHILSGFVGRVWFYDLI